MEPVSRLSHDPFPKVTTTFPSNALLSKHLHSILMELARVSSLLLLISIQVLSLLKKWNPIFHLLPLSCFFLFFLLKPLLTKPHIYIVDFSCFKPPSFCRIPLAAFLENASMIQPFDKQGIDFMAKLIKSSGLGETTHLSPSFSYIPPISNLQEHIKEFHMVIFPVMQDLLSKTNLSPRKIDILIVNCSSLCSSPSLSSIIINKYKMRDDIKTFNVSGMGCSAGILSIHLAINLLKVHKNSNAVVLSTEITSAGWYAGNDKSKLLVNSIFRMGGAAILLTNKEGSRNISKYRLIQAVRINRAFDDRAYNSTVREEDENGALGVSVTHDLVKVVGETVRTNIAVLGSCILPLSEKFKVGVSMFRKRYIRKSAAVYVPDFKRVIQHFVMPASGRSWIREIGKGLKLGKIDTEASLMTLRRFGNQSSSSSWYVLAYLEAKERMNKGDKVWQLGIGSGPKCISFVWECNRPVVGESSKGPWADCIHEYPVHSADRE